MLAGWGIIVHKQKSGTYLCQTVFIQLDDTFDPSLGALSGVYDRDTSQKLFSAGRAKYVERRSGNSWLAYCGEQKVWSISIGGNGKDQDPCIWQAKSAEAQSYDIVDMASSTWFVQSEEGRIVPMQYSEISCYYDNIHSSGETPCGSHGEPVKKPGTLVEYCKCNDVTTWSEL